MTRTAADTTPKDNLFGVCNAIGEDLGFNPLWLRIALASVFLFAPVLVIGGYFVAGAIVLVARIAFPRPKAQATAVVETVAVPTIAQNEAPMVFARAA